MKTDRPDLEPLRAKLSAQGELCEEPEDRGSETASERPVADEDTPGANTDKLSMARALIAEGLKHEVASRADQPKCTCNGAAWCEDWCPARPRVDRAHEAEMWFDENRRRLLDGYAAALDASDQTELTEHFDVYRSRCQQLAARVTALSAALSAMIARVRRTGGYATPEEQDVLRQAELALVGQPPGGAENAARLPQERAEDFGRDHRADRASALTAALLSACDLGEPLRGLDDPRLRAPHLVELLPVVTTGLTREQLH